MFRYIFLGPAHRGEILAGDNDDVKALKYVRNNRRAEGNPKAQRFKSGRGTQSLLVCIGWILYFPETGIPQSFGPNILVSLGAEIGTS